jgi:dipeptidyl aminopeptidase/acylaminoacyl peptidase
MLSKNSLLISILFLTINSLVQADSHGPKANESSQSLEVLTLEKIMADPDWMGNSPESPSWSLDSQKIFYKQKAAGHRHRNTFSINLTDSKISEVDLAKYLIPASSKAKLNSTRNKGVFAYQGDIYLIDLLTNKIRALNSDGRRQSHPTFVNDTTISYRVGYQLFLYHLDTQLEQQIADFKLANDPDKKEQEDYLEQSQPRLLGYLKNKQQERKFQEERRKEMAQNPFKTWYLGKSHQIKTFRLAPDAKWLLLGITIADTSRVSDNMPEFVTEDGYVNNRKVRPLVGTSKPSNETFYLVDLVQQKKQRLDLSNLPGINDDPLKAIRKKAAKKIGYKFKEKDSARAVYAYDWAENQGVEWTKDSKKAAILLFSYDNKSRWIVTFDTKNKSLKTAHWLSDDAWVNDWTFNQFGWLADNNTLYYLSEEDGYSHLYIKTGKRKSSQLTDGHFEVSDLTPSKAGDIIYYRANKKHPGIYEIYAYDIQKRNSRAVTNLSGNNDYVLSPDENSMLVTHSDTTTRPELYLKKLSAESPSQKLTSTSSNEFKSIAWQAPKIIAINSTNVDRSIYSRLYTPSTAQNSNKRPAVMFVHGAGYLQNSHQGWSGYFREFMFHNYLIAKGFVVLDMDYRASKGYGRDWRTAIYRNMGTPELQDLKDGARWLVDNQNVDASKIGIYGGSYGGFMTFMALFKEPELFAAGAALRPVTDWSHYNHGYTSNILNTPQVDPMAYERSSPIEFASGLSKPLLICHGMVDDNVFFKDTVRLVQKLIELKKTKYFETAIYPVEPHGFKQPSSWLDEYTRIDQLFERTLR